VSGALATNPFRGRRASERTHNVCYVASGAASAPVVWRRGGAAVSGRLNASGVTGHTCRPRLAGARSLPARPEGDGGAGLASSLCRVVAMVALRWAGRTGEALRRQRRGAPVARGNRARERGSGATNAGRGERKGALPRSRPLCALVGGAQRRATGARQRCDVGLARRVQIIQA